MKVLIIGILALSSLNTFANTACMDKISSELEREQRSAQPQQMQIQGCGGVSFNILHEISGFSCRAQNYIEELQRNVKRKSHQRKAEYLELAQNLENNEFDIPQMRAVLGRHVNVNSVIDHFQANSVCFGDEQDVKVISKVKMKRLVK